MTDDKQYCDGNGYCLKRLTIDSSALAEGWARATAWHKHGIAWNHLEQISRDELLAEASAHTLSGDQ